PIQVSCHGSMGWLNVSYEPNRVLNYDLFLSGHSLKGQIAPLQNAQYYSPGGSAYSCSNCAGHASWLSLAGSVAKKVWTPAQTDCAPTRAPNICTPRTIPAHFENSWVWHFDLMLNQVGPGQYSFNRVEFNLPQGKALIKSLGANTTCFLK